jgi:hypothetical protein
LEYNKGLWENHNSKSEDLFDILEETNYKTFGDFYEVFELKKDTPLYYH